MSTAVASRLCTEQEYLASEREAEVRHELLNGEIYEMPGGTRGHSLIVTNVLAGLHRLLAARDCEVHRSDMRVRIPGVNLITYPDVSALCGAPQLLDGSRDVLLNPQVIFEVLSESSESYDRGDKFQYYRQLPSLADYLLVSQAKVLVEHYTRQADDSWNLRELHSGSTLELTSIGCALEVDDVYRKVFCP